MTSYSPEAFINFLLDNNVVGFFEKPITLKSGRKSSWYVNWRTVSNDVFLFDQLTDFVLSFVNSKKLQADCFYGVPEGATKLGLLATYKFAKQQKNYQAGSHVLAQGRAKPKEHGAVEDKYFIGMPRGRVIVVEDVTTTGGSLLTTVAQLQEAGVNIVAAVGLTNRSEKRDDCKTVAEALKEKSVQYLALSEADAFLPAAIKRFKPSAEIIASIQNEFAEFGAKPLAL